MTDYQQLHQLLTDGVDEYITDLRKIWAKHSTKICILGFSCISRSNWKKKTQQMMLPSTQENITNLQNTLLSILTCFSSFTVPDYEALFAVVPVFFIPCGCSRTHVQDLLSELRGKVPCTAFAMKQTRQWAPQLNLANWVIVTKAFCTNVIVTKHQLQTPA